VRPSTDCCNCRLDRTRIAPVDWVALASLRDSENTILDYQSVDDASAGITMPGTLASWFTACGYTQLRNETNLFLTKGRGEIDAAHQLRLQGRRVCLFINSNMLSSVHNTDRSWSPDHWVVLTTPAGVVNGALSIRVYSWGRIYAVPATGSLTVDHFSRNFYGFVAALFPHS
jgi:hypothetical protein